MKSKTSRNSYKKCVCLFCLSNFILGLDTATARDGARAHPIKKIDTTPNNRDEDIWTFTLESNTYRSTVYLSPVLDFSSRNGWDIQIASYNIPAYGGGAQNYEWDSYINLSKTFDINAQFKALLGTQNGTTLFSTQRQFHNVEYALALYQPIPAANIHAGPYWANKALSTTTDVFAYTAGFGVELIKNKLAVQGDYFSGHSNVSGAIVNVLYRILPQAQVYIGVGVPETHSGNEFYGTVGFSVFSKASAEEVDPPTVEQ
ncbi:MAG: hypothetical protein PHY16_11500 [Methylobacter sp.]|nr:hypothetical protein [Methylobacter sp.]